MSLLCFSRRSKKPRHPNCKPSSRNIAPTGTVYWQDYGSPRPAHSPKKRYVTHPGYAHIPPSGCKQSYSGEDEPPGLDDAIKDASRKASFEATNLSTEDVCGPQGSIRSLWPHSPDQADVVVRLGGTRKHAFVGHSSATARRLPERAEIQMTIGPPLSTEQKDRSGDIKHSKHGQTTRAGGQNTVSVHSSSRNEDYSGGSKRSQCDQIPAGTSSNRRKAPQRDRAKAENPERNERKPLTKPGARVPDVSKSSVTAIRSLSILSDISSLPPESIPSPPQSMRSNASKRHQNVQSLERCIVEPALPHHYYPCALNGYPRARGTQSTTKNMSIHASHPL